jgi:ABC-type dipeptide/oligopeptide/nickel transport system ATPase subunit
MRDVELEISLLDQRPPQLSGGQLQRVCPRAGDPPDAAHP